METPSSDIQTQGSPTAHTADARIEDSNARSNQVGGLGVAGKHASSPTRLPSIIVIVALAGQSIWYLVRPQPLLVLQSCMPSFRC